MLKALCCLSEAHRELEYNAVKHGIVEAATVPVTLIFVHPAKCGTCARATNLLDEMVQNIGI